MKVASMKVAGLAAHEFPKAGVGVRESAVASFTDNHLAGENLMRENLAQGTIIKRAGEGQARAQEMRARPDQDVIEFQIFSSSWDYSQAVQAMQNRARAVGLGQAPEAVWFLQHPSVYTLGPRTPQSEQEALDLQGLAWVRTPRGGQVTYHGPGQRIIYAVINLRRRGLSAGVYVAALEDWIIAALGGLGVPAYRWAPHTGIWTNRGKIAALGVHIQGGVTMHGAALNVSSAVLPWFSRITPCGLDQPVTALQLFRPQVSWEEVDWALFRHCPFLPLSFV